MLEVQPTCPSLSMMPGEKGPLVQGRDSYHSEMLMLMMMMVAAVVMAMV